MGVPKHRKLLVVGFRAVGKSTVTIQFTENHFVEGYAGVTTNSCLMTCVDTIRPLRTLFIRP